MHQNLCFSFTELNRNNAKYKSWIEWQVGNYNSNWKRRQTKAKLSGINRRRWRLRPKRRQQKMVLEDCLYFHTTLPELRNYFRYFKLARMCYTMLRFFWRLGNSGENGRADLSPIMAPRLQISRRRWFSPFSGTMTLHIRITWLYIEFYFWGEKNYNEYMIV